MSELGLKHILVPIDFSEPSKAALEYAAELASRSQAKLSVLHVLEKAPAEIPGSSGNALSVFGSVRDQVRDWLIEVLSEQNVRELTPAVLLRVGAPHVEILHVARERDVSLIVMGTHGRASVQHVLMGSVAEDVVRRAPCPVLTIRKGQVFTNLEAAATRGAMTQTH